MAGRMTGRVALVTGGGGGIGEATARLFAEEGGAVALVDVDRRAADTAAAAIAAAVPGASVVPLAADVAREPEARRAVADAVSRLGALHALVNVAGIRVYAPLAEATDEDWRRIVDVNVLATAFCAKAALPSLRAAGNATIVNVSSVFGVLGRAGMGQYDTTKAAVLGFTRALAVEEAPHGIRVNAVCPGGTITRYHVERAARQGMSETELRRSRAQDNGLFGRWAEPREVAYPILFLSCSESSFITGATLMVDAGKSVL
jgi:NAD(P)-dependent dehydrogenase (short-subunit alcohol dehydrogenase family)